MENNFSEQNYFGVHEEEASQQELKEIANNALSVLVMMITMLLLTAIYFFN